MISTSVFDVRALLADDPTFEENDEPMAGQPHRDPIDSLYYSLRDRLAGPRVYVAAELRVYRDLAAVRARAYREPDLLVVLDRPDEQRLVYLLSEEGKAPDFVLEVLSDTTYQNDLGEKRRWYREIGVREYVVIDLEGAYVGERRLQRWRLEEEGPQSVAPPDVGLEGETITSLVLPYGLKVREGWVRLVDPESGDELPLLREQLAQGRLDAQLRREAQAQALEELERRLTAQARQREAETQAREELELRLTAQARQHEAETRQREEREQRLNAQTQAQVDREQRLVAEARVAAETEALLAAGDEIARLRRELQRLQG